MAPMTKGSNLPYRRLCDAYGATITMGEMAVARQLKRKVRSEYALLRRHPEERVFGVQLAGRGEEELEWATALAVERGADLVDLNCGCPIHEITRRGLGSALLAKPSRIARLVEAMVRGAGEVPVTVKIRLAYETSKLVHTKVARVAVEAGAAAIVVHGRTRDGRYRSAADWDRIGEVVEAVDVPVIGNGDLIWPEEIAAGRARSGCAGVMLARGALIKPWVFEEAANGKASDPSAEERVAMMERYVALAREHWGDDEGATKRIRGFLVWHLDFWSRYVPPSPDGTLARLQEREDPFTPRSELEALLARGDRAAHEWWADRLLLGAEAAGDPPAPEEGGRDREVIPQG